VRLRKVRRAVAGRLALWTVGYGAVQAAAPALVRRSLDGLATEVPAARLWSLLLLLAQDGPGAANNRGKLTALQLEAPLAEGCDCAFAGRAGAAGCP